MSVVRTTVRAVVHYGVGGWVSDLPRMNIIPYVQRLCGGRLPHTG